MSAPVLDMEKARSNEEAQQQKLKPTLHDGKQRTSGQEAETFHFRPSCEQDHRATHSFVASLCLFLTILLLCIAWKLPFWKQHELFDIFAFCGFKSSGEMSVTGPTPLTGNLSCKLSNPHPT